METWKRWVPQIKIPDSFHYESIISTINGVTLQYVDEERKTNVNFLFQGLVYSYRFTEEACLLRTLDFLRETHEKEIFDGWCLFTIENSDYMKWFEQESYDAYDITKFTHYAIYTQEGLAEVISPYSPEIETLQR